MKLTWLSFSFSLQYKRTLSMRLMDPGRTQMDIFYILKTCNRNLTKFVSKLPHSCLMRGVIFEGCYFSYGNSRLISSIGTDRVDIQPYKRDNDFVTLPREEYKSVSTVLFHLEIH